MNNNVGEKFFPIGTVVILKGATKRLMVTGFCPVPKNGENKMYDYSGCLYPEGFISSDQNALFNHDQIANVLFMGWSDDEEKDFKVQLNEILKSQVTGQSDASAETSSGDNAPVAPVTPVELPKADVVTTVPAVDVPTVVTPSIVEPVVSNVTVPVEPVEIPKVDTVTPVPVVETSNVVTPGAVENAVPSSSVPVEPITPVELPKADTVTPLPVVETPSVVTPVGVEKVIPSVPTPVTSTSVETPNVVLPSTMNDSVATAPQMVTPVASDAVVTPTVSANFSVQPTSVPSVLGTPAPATDSAIPSNNKFII